MHRSRWRLRQIRVVGDPGLLPVHDCVLARRLRLRSASTLPAFRLRIVLRARRCLVAQVLPELVRKEIWLWTIQNRSLETSEMLNTIAWAAASSSSAGRRRLRALHVERRIIDLLRKGIFDVLWPILRLPPQRKVTRHIRPLLRQLLDACLPREVVDA